MAKKDKKTGDVLFEEYYSKRWGERWPDLKTSLYGEIDHYSLEEDLLQPYFLDEASLFPPRELAVEKGESVLDMCAAPGGKSLILASALAGTGRLTVNDLSPDRRRRLRQVMENHLRPEWRENIEYSGYDGSLWYRYEPSSYDKILLDAPCSSERHVLNSPEHLKKWSPGRIRSLAPRQFSLLCSALDTVKPGGLIVYSTCALAEEENDMIIDRLLKKERDDSLWNRPSLIGEKTPDTGIISFPITIRPVPSITAASGVSINGGGNALRKHQRLLLRLSRRSLAQRAKWRTFLSGSSQSSAII